jgi:hypothetical protein
MGEKGLIARMVLALGACQLYTMARWHAELIYPMSAPYAATISSGFVSWSGAAAVRFDHLLMWSAGLAVIVMAVDYLRLAMEVDRDDE